MGCWRRCRRTLCAGPASQDLSLAERILKARNVQVAANFHAELAAFGDLPLREIMACAGTAESEGRVLAASACVAQRASTRREVATSRYQRG